MQSIKWTKLTLLHGFLCIPLRRNFLLCRNLVYILFTSRAYSSCFMHAIVARLRLAFFKVFLNFVHFCPNFQIFCPFLPFFWKIARMPLLSRIGPDIFDMAYGFLINFLHSDQRFGKKILHLYVCTWIWNMWACATHNYSLVHTTYTFLYQVSVSNFLEMFFFFMFFLEILSGVQLRTWNVEAMKLKLVCINSLKGQCAVYRPERFLRKVTRRIQWNHWTKSIPNVRAEFQNLIKNFQAVLNIWTK